MKKLALGAVLGASLMISSSAFALTAMTDSNMKSATGQAGVSITIDNVVIEQYAGSTTYTDTDGSGKYVNNLGAIATGTEAYIEISDKHSLKTFLAMTSEFDYKNDFLTMTKGEASIGSWQKAKALSIDVGNCSILAAGLTDNFKTGVTKAQKALDTTTGFAAVDYGAAGFESLDAAFVNKLVAAGTLTAADVLTKTATFTATVNNDTARSAFVTSAVPANLITSGLAEDASEVTGLLDDSENEIKAYNKTVAGVVIGLPTLLINTTGDEYTVKVGMTGAFNNGDEFIKIKKGDSTMAILSGTVEIAAH